MILLKAPPSDFHSDSRELSFFHLGFGFHRRGSQGGCLGLSGASHCWLLHFPSLLGPFMYLAVLKSFPPVTCAWSLFSITSLLETALTKVTNDSRKAKSSRQLSTLVSAEKWQHLTEPTSLPYWSASFDWLSEHSSRILPLFQLLLSFLVAVCILLFNVDVNAPLDSAWSPLLLFYYLNSSFSSMVLTNVTGHHHEARSAEGPRNSSMNQARYWFLLSLHWGRNKKEMLKNYEWFGNKQETGLKKKRIRA